MSFEKIHKMFEFSWNINLPDVGLALPWNEKRRQLERKILWIGHYLKERRLTELEFQKLTKVRRSDFRKVFHLLVHEGIVERYGVGRKCKPYLYLVSKPFRENPDQQLRSKVVTA